MIYRILFIILLISSGNIVFSQVLPFSRSIKIVKRQFFGSKDYEFYYLDTLTGDTIKETKISVVRYNVNKDTIELALLNVRDNFGKCGDEGYETACGDYFKYNSDGVIIEMGEFICNAKHGTWLQFYDNGTLSKYENYGGSELYFPLHMSLRNGNYYEYYPDGRLMVEGHFKVILEYGNYEDFNINTYEMESICCGWNVVSVKYGIWRFYNSKGKLSRKKDYSVDLRNTKKYKEIIDPLKFTIK